ncbi:hypothetical protein AGR6A_pb0068 [Agrobacterium sp. NCPPB 925]|nr:hypothetical protein AGR6A_pb0068 [Agrobacterium sp. NCPPB 925]
MFKNHGFSLFSFYTIITHARFTWYGSEVLAQHLAHRHYRVDTPHRSTVRNCPVNVACLRC